MLVKHQYTRVMILATPSYVAPQDRGAWKWSLATTAVKTIGGSAYEEFSGLGKFVESWPVEGENALAWTMFRVGFLTGGASVESAKEPTTSFTGSGLDGFSVSRANVAVWVLKEIGKGDWVGRAPVLSG